ncbi:MAG: RNA polymerase sigma-70 factor [Agriterribacter sp.]
MRDTYTYSGNYRAGIPADGENKMVFDEIYTMYWKKLFTIAYKMLNEKQEAEDVVHDVFVSLWVNRGKVEIISLENYLHTAVKNLVFTKLKKRAHQLAYIKSLGDQTLTSPSVVASIHNKQVLEKIQNEIESLPEKCRQIFKCSRNEGMPVKQIAKKLNISPKTVENQLNKALKQLRLVIRTFLNLF